MNSNPALANFSKLCGRVAHQIQKVMDAPYMARLKDMIFRDPNEAPKPFDRAAAMAWLERAAPRRPPPGVSAVPSAKRPSIFGCDLTSRLREWNALAKPSARQVEQWNRLHAEARGEAPALSMGLAR